MLTSGKVGKTNPFAADMGRDSPRRWSVFVVLRRGLGKSAQHGEKSRLVFAKTWDKSADLSQVFLPRPTEYRKIGEGIAEIREHESKSWGEATSIGNVFWKSRAHGAKRVENRKSGSDVFYPLCLKLLRPLCRLRRMCAFVGYFSNKPSCKSLFCIWIAMSELRF